MTPEEFGNIVVRANPDGSQRPAQGRGPGGARGAELPAGGALQRQTGGVIAVFQTPGSNALKVATGPEESPWPKLKAGFPHGLDYEVALDTTLPIVEGMHESGRRFVEALLLVIVVVFVFLQAGGPPSSRCSPYRSRWWARSRVFPLLGFSLNTLSLFGLVLAIGVVVDDAIVVVEAVEYQIGRGMPRGKRRSRRWRRWPGPVVGDRPDSGAVFIPVAFVPGITGRLYQQFALTMAVSV